MRVDDLVIGQTVEFKAFGEWRTGTVRALSTMRGRAEARVDNGHPGTDDLHTNGATCSAWVRGDGDLRPAAAMGLFDAR